MNALKVFIKNDITNIWPYTIKVIFGSTYNIFQIYYAIFDKYYKYVKNIDIFKYSKIAL